MTPGTLPQPLFPAGDTASEVREWAAGIPPGEERHYAEVYAYWLPHREWWERCHFRGLDGGGVTRGRAPRGGARGGDPATRHVDALGALGVRPESGALSPET